MTYCGTRILAVPKQENSEGRVSKGLGLATSVLCKSPNGMANAVCMHKETPASSGNHAKVHVSQHDNRPLDG